MGSDLNVSTDPAEVGIDADPAGPDRPPAGPLGGRRAAARLPGHRRPARASWCTSAGTAHRDVENGLPVTDDTRWRIYSMTKPVTSVAAMMLYEEGAFELNDPISKWLPEFAETPRLRRRVGA